MTGRKVPLPRTASPRPVRALLPLLLVVFCCSAPVRPASSVGRQGAVGDVGQPGSRDVLSSVWRHGGGSYVLNADDLPNTEGDGEVVRARTWDLNDGDYSESRSVALQRRRHLYHGEYPVTRKSVHRSHESLDADKRSSENSKRSSSSFFVSSEWRQPTSSSGRKGPRDIRPGNWAQEDGEFERVSSGDESSKRKASLSQHKSSIMRGRGEWRRAARGGELLSRRGREVLADNSQADFQADKNLARFTSHGNENPSHSSTPLGERLAALGTDGAPHLDHFGVPVDSEGYIPPSIDPAAYPLREHQWHSGTGTMPLEAPHSGFSDYRESLQPGLVDQTPYDLEEVLAREEAALAANTLMVHQPPLE
ncbi:hypothetical protein E2C01_078986 [Portunus trituberculatus]|uniref:Uncharacterized protein n=1 Tax=Portunus trituberculatus TaxID=210409 RepID=A0A5B7IP57_PORTR|nr:hypothetical protein [Portunus trituberculatus]